MRFLVLFFVPIIIYANSVKDDPLICIHGILAGPWSMRYIERHFEKNGYQVINWGYPSLEKKIEEHADCLVKELQKVALTQPGRPINFIAHSLGCLVVRSAINHPSCPNEAKMGRVVLLTPPNQGSAWGRFLEQFVFVRKVLKEESGRQVLSESNFKFLGNFPSSMHILVIAGNWGFNPFIEGENDGTVGVSETYLDTPHEHIVINSGHKSILVSQRALRLMQEFLEREGVLN